ncbi:CopD family protein [Arhodomonas aquaeolei]|uniref:CopD family protein n=1 Tax=Arhodomonas aquaeolei TaxID=2369 RepID=UPI002167C3DD|nr:CopD family protein [Arhodomonas aquaeolei]MCS4502873.1 CopD family protein [Arhodomonas aquaeolei]
MFWEIPVLMALHLIAAVVWIGGMFLAYTCLRPAAGALEPSVRGPLWHGVLRRFLAAVWVAVVVLPASGYRMSALRFGGLADAPAYVHAMQAIGWVMIALFVYLYFGPYRRLGRAVADGSTGAAGAALGRTRRVVQINLGLGMALLVVVAAGRFFAF